MRIVVPSVNYADLLAVSLPVLVSLVGSSPITVLTAAEDRNTHAVAKACGVSTFVTDAWTRTDRACHRSRARTARVGKFWQQQRKDDAPTFNLALALDEAFGLAGPAWSSAPADGDVLAVIDADVVPVGRWPSDDDIQAGVIYGAMRYACPTSELYAAFVSGVVKLDDLKPMRASGRIEQSQHRDVPNVGEGYCQIFRYRPGLRFGSYPGADEYDFDLALRFAKGELLKGLSFVHLGRNARNWDGRITEQWHGATA